MKRLGILLAVLVGLAILTWRLTRFGSEASPVAIETREQIATRGDAAVVPVPDAQPFLEERRAAEDGASATAPLAEAAPLALSVRDPLGAPVAGALVVLFRGETVLGNARMDDAGNAHVPAPGGEGEYVLFADGWEFSRGAIDLSAGSRTLSLVEGATVAGRVLVDGAAPRAPIELVWSTSPVVASGREWRQIPKSVRGVVLREGRRILEVSQFTAPDGSFAFRGLAQKAEGRIRWPGPFFVAGLPNSFPRREVEIPVPRLDVLLMLESGFELRARVVDPSGEPIANANGTLKFESSRPLMERFISDGDGRVVKALPRTVGGTLRIVVGRTNLTTPQIFQFELPSSSDSGWDLGDLVLDPTRRVAIRVQDESGAPIPEARVTAWVAEGPGNGLRDTTNGSLELELALGAQTVLVQAFGYQAAKISVPAEATEIVATLVRASAIEFVPPAEVADARGLSLILEADGPLFVDEDAEGAWRDRTRGGRVSIERETRTTRAVLRDPTSERWRISALMPGTPLRATVRSQARELCSLELAPLLRGEHRRVELSFLYQRREFAVRVVDAAGEPIEGAKVLRFPGADPRQEPSQVGVADGDGTCRIGTDEFRCLLLVRANGHSPHAELLDPLPTDPREIRLEPERIVEVELVRKDGSLLTEAARVSATSSLTGFSPAEAIGSGRYRLRGIPRGTATITVLTLGKVLSRTHETAVPFLRVVVDEAGSVLAYLRGNLQGTEQDWTICVSAAGSSTVIVRAEFRAFEPSRWVAGFRGLGSGRFEARLEQRSATEVDGWVPVGERQTFELSGEEHPTVLEFELPR